MGDQMHPLDPELVEHAAEVVRIAGHGVVDVPAHLCGGEARHVRGDHLGVRNHAVQE